LFAVNGNGSLVRKRSLKGKLRTNSAVTPKMIPRATEWLQYWDYLSVEK